MRCGYIRRNNMFVVFISFVMLSTQNVELLPRTFLKVFISVTFSEILVPFTVYTSYFQNRMQFRLTIKPQPNG